jgi:sigma-B regulation protein RsbU (phosphoserine phosphatase)
VLLRAFRDSETSPSQLLVRLDDRIKDSLQPGTFITMFYGILDPVTRTLLFSSAGHSPLLVYRAGTKKSEWHKTRGIPLGAVRGGVIAKTLEDEQIELGPGDVVVQYTDGINEAFDISGEHQFGFDRLEKVTSQYALEGCRAVIEAIRTEVENWAGDQPPLDDETLVVLGVEGAPTVPTDASEEKKAPATVTEKKTAPAAAERKTASSGKTGAKKKSTGTRAKENAQASAEKLDPLATLEAAQRSGHRLSLSADLDGLTRIREWLATCPGIEGLESREVVVLESALYEVCANIAEHGYQKDKGKTFELWWTPPSADETNGEEGGFPSVGYRGLFLVVDQGRPFRPPELVGLDFRDPAVRRRRRGIGLKIIHRAMSRVSYHPGTSAGNITILGFDPAKIQVKEGVSHG